jgi:phosphohistidine phosphatase
MPKYLLIIRHAKAKEIELGQADFERKLSKRGKSDAEELGGELKKMNVIPDTFYVSPAKRTHKTAEIIAEELNLTPEKIQLLPEIYEAAQHTLLKIINKFDRQSQIACLIGHNPGLTLIADYLSGGKVDFLPTCGSVYLQFDLDDWQMISKNTGQLLWLKSPKESD